MFNNFSSLLWLVAIIAMIPLSLWVLKRTPMGGGGSNGMLRCVAALALSPNQRIVTVEVGHGEERRWLVLGITPQSITTLHSMEPQPLSSDALPPAHPFAELMGKFGHLREHKGTSGEN